MSKSATLSDFEDVLRRVGSDAIQELGRASAAIQAEAALKGALSNSRIVFSYSDALEQSWSRSADQMMSELRRWTADSKVRRTALRNVAENELRRMIPSLVEASKVERARQRFRNQNMLQPATERIDALENDLTFRLRQFDINMDVPQSSVLPPVARRSLSWIADNVAQILTGLLVLVIAAALGLSG